MFCSFMWAFLLYIRHSSLSRTFFISFFKHIPMCFNRFLGCNSISLARFRHPVKHFFLPISTFFIPLTGLWCPLVERLNRIHLFRHKVNTFFAFICVFLCNYTIFSHSIHKSCPPAHFCTGGQLCPANRFYFSAFLDSRSNNSFIICGYSLSSL